MSTTNIPDSLKLGMIVFPDQVSSPLALEHTQVNVHLIGLIATVVVTQTFSNPLDAFAELEYLFPLPEQAALEDFSIHIGERIIHADLREIEQAKEAYDQARQEGKHAALLEQRRSNLIAIKLANVMPGESIRSIVQYEERLALQPGELEFVFPMGLTPRYHSPEHPEESHGVNPPVALPGERIGPIQIEVLTDLGFNGGKPVSPTHTVEIEELAPGQFNVRLSGRNVPDHDFVLRFPMGSNPVEISAWAAQDTGGEVLLANWLPAFTDPEESKPLPREFIFVLDRSGSMTGEPIRQACNALRACLRILETQDSFRILLFDDQVDWYREKETPVNQSEIEQADRFLSAIGGRGGTEIVQALETVLKLRPDPERTRFIVFLTDGAVSAESRVFDQIRQQVGQSRIFTFGIGPSVNRGLLSKMAQIGRGAATYLQLDEDIESAIIRFQDKVAFPMLTEIQMEWENCKVWDAYPAVLPDLYAGEPLLFACRIKRGPGKAGAAMHITGKRGKEFVHYHLHLPENKPDLPEVTRAWAQARIEDLMEQTFMQREPLHRVRQEVISLALEHHLLTPFTAFVALDSEIVNETGQSRPVAIAQPLPKGLDWNGFYPSPSAPVMLPHPMTAAPRPHVRTAKLVRDDSESASPLMAFAQGAHRPDAGHQPTPLQRGQAGFNDPLPPGEELSLPPEKFDPESILRWLARSQKLDGSWRGEVEFSAAALLAFVRHGQTTLRGHYRRQVKRAADWLSHAVARGEAAFAQVLALHLLAVIDQNQAWEEWVKRSHQSLPAPATSFERAVIAILDVSDDRPILNPDTHTWGIDEIRCAAVLNTLPLKPENLANRSDEDLARVWLAAINL